MITDDPVAQAVLESPAPVAPILRAAWAASAAALSIAPRHGLDPTDLAHHVANLLGCRPGLAQEVLDTAIELGRATVDDHDRIHPPNC